MTTSKDQPPTTSGHTRRLSPAERARMGKDARRVAPLDSHADLRSGKRSDPVALLAEEDVDRVPELVPIRYGRMLTSSFTFFRGAAALIR